MASGLLDRSIVITTIEERPQVPSAAESSAWCPLINKPHQAVPLAQPIEAPSLDSPEKKPDPRSGARSPSTNQGDQPRALCRSRGPSTAAVVDGAITQW